MTGDVAIESLLILIVSGFVLFVVIVSVVVGGILFWVLSTVAESLLLVDIVDSLVPQLTANIPIPTAVSNNFFILFYFGVYNNRKSIIIPNRTLKIVKYR